MKTPIHVLAPAALILSILQLQLLTPTLYAAVPMRWTVDVSRVQPEVRDVVRGETIALEATLKNDGKPFAMGPEPVCIFWQTNGMANAWWSAPATAKPSQPTTNNQQPATNILSAVFTPAMDPGAATVNGFLGSTGDMYRAAFQLRFRHGPGAVPNVIEQPPPVLDLAHTVVINPPWPTDQTIDARIRQVIAADDITANVPTGMVRTVVSNTVTKAYVESLGISGGGSSIDTNTVIDIAQSVVAPAVNAAVNTGRAITASAAAAGTNYTDTVVGQLSSQLSQLSQQKADSADVASMIDTAIQTSKVERIYSPDGLQYQTSDGGSYVLRVNHDYFECEFTPYHRTYVFAWDEELQAYYRDGTTSSYPQKLSFNSSSGRWILSSYSSGTWNSIAYTSGSANDGRVELQNGNYIFTRKSGSTEWVKDKQVAYTQDLAAKADSADVSSLSSQVSGLASSKADAADLEPIRTAANDALAYGRGIFTYMNGTTNCYFSGTNYVIGAESTNRTAFALENGMDLASVPCSMALWEIRDGTRQCVWDQRDWTVWYWNFKIAQYRSEHDGRDAALRALIEGRCPIAWSSRTACGLTNAAGDTTWIDTPKVVLAAGYAWQHQLTVDGVGYWGIQGNGFEVGGSGTNSTLRITDWEGNEVLKITKGSARLAYLTGGSGVASGWDGGWMWYDMLCDAQPTGEFTVDLLDTFVEEGDGCPAEVREYVDRGNGVWRCYFRARPGINATACFARFKVQVGTETTVEYGTAPTVPGLIVNGRKIAPVIPASAQVGDTITWKVVQ